MTTRTAPDQITQSREEAILDAAFDAFQLHGYRRCSMEDIAKNAGMSRAALYLHYRNKDDIFRSLIRRAYDEGVAALAAALDQDLPPSEALRAGFAAKTSGMIEALVSSPHGPELVERAMTLDEGEHAAGEAQIAAVFAAWLEREEARGRIDLSPVGATPREVATTLLAALNGLKTAKDTLDDYRRRLDQLAILFGRALAA